MSMVLGDDSDADLAEWRDLESSLTDERLQVFKDKKTELNKATVRFCFRNRVVPCSDVPALLYAPSIKFHVSGYLWR